MNSFHSNLFGSRSTINDSVDGVGNSLGNMRVTPTITPISPNAAIVGQYQASPRTTPVDPLPTYFSPFQQGAAVAAPRSTLPSSLQGSASSLTGNGFVEKETKVFLFAMKRCENIDGSTYLVLVHPKSGQRYNVAESVLAEHGIQLGDFLHAEKEDENALKNYAKKDISSFTDFRFKVKVEGDMAVVTNNKANLIEVNGLKVFQSKHFGDAHCEQQTQRRGTYMTHLVLLPRTVTSITGHTLNFQAINSKPFNFAPKAQRLENATNNNQFQGRPHRYQNQNQNQNQLPNQNFAKSPSGFLEKPPVPKTTGKGFAEKAQPNAPIVGGGFAPSPSPTNLSHGSSSSPRASPIVGQGFAPAQQKAPTVGKGFTSAPSNAPIVGKGFAVNEKPLQKSKAVVMSSQKSDKGETTHYLWLLDKRAEGRFKTKEYTLEMGHFFEGEFKEDPKSKKFECKKYTKGIEAVLEGGIEDGQIWLKVKADNYQKTVNQQFASLTAKWIGEILDTESKLTEKKGATVKIQRKGMAEKEYVWSILEVLL